MLATVRNVETSPEQMSLVFKYLDVEGWTPSEFAKACHRVATDPAIAKQVGYNGCLTPDVFTMARQGTTESVMTYDEMMNHARRNKLTVVVDYRKVGNGWMAL